MPDVDVAFQSIELSPDHLLVRLAAAENELQAKAQEKLKDELVRRQTS